jgi:hypothetical protein
MKLAHTVLALSAALTCVPSVAGPALEDLKACIGDHTSGKDRKDLAVWLFSAMSVHPSMKTLSPVPPAAREQADKSAARIMSRIFSQDCVSQAVATVKAEGPNSLHLAGQTLGALAMQELMTDKGVSEALGGISKHVDMTKFERAMADAAKK